MGAENEITKIFSLFDKNELTRLPMDLVNISAPPGEEGDIVRFIVQWLRTQGIEAFLQEIEERRYHAVGQIGGSGSGVGAKVEACFSRSGYEGKGVEPLC